MGEGYNEQTGAVLGNVRKLLTPKASTDARRVLMDLYEYLAPSGQVVTADYTTSNLAGVEKVICNSASLITVTLTNQPKDLNKVQVIRAGAGAVTVAGNGNNINGSSSYSVASQYDSVTFEWFEDLSRWIVHG